jgi:hypothetical protein
MIRKLKDSAKENHHMSLARKIIIRTNSVVFLTAFVWSTPIYGVNENNSPGKGKEVKQKKREDKKEEPPKIGNFVLPTSQQPGPLVSFGERIVDKNQTHLILFADDFRGHKKHAVDIIPSLLYGITDDTSVFFNVPIAASYKDNKNHSSGLEDIFMQLEYAFYGNKTSQYVDQATVVGNVTFPSGSPKKQPLTGFGSSSFFLGATFNRTYTDWFMFTSPGILLTSSHDRTKFGNEFLYQAGFGRNIFNIDSEWIFAWMIEGDGLYIEKDKIRGITDPNSGGNVLYVTPSLFISSKKIIAQLGFGLPATQHLFGNQNKNHYLLVANFEWTF